MSRTPHPWFRKSKNAWYVCLDGRQILLAKGKANKAAAHQKFHELMTLSATARADQGSSASVAAVCDTFLDWCSKRRRPKTYEWYRHSLQDLAEFLGRMHVVDVKPFHITRWIDRHSWNTGLPLWFVPVVMRVSGPGPTCAAGERA
ncbi:hypothetical protein Pan216_37890 [Planctomycetes bacterium Pan216]|uniref:Integrase SAM-like N-terminal domain-containing protein n=1 Tax=Kolteria novifilia TaxID=2527975 RepID=A0A518B7G7_9BACT|nr:hypothetical protein Pan216_37890 [Planctomycetes bacterium Pan216]